MSQTRKKPVSRYAQEAALYFAQLIRVTRIEKKMTMMELSVRAGISRALLSRIEKGDVSVSLGAYFEVAFILEIPLFDSHKKESAIYHSFLREQLKLLPKSVRRKDDFVGEEF